MRETAKQRLERKQKEFDMAKRRTQCNEITVIVAIIAFLFNLTVNFIVLYHILTRG